MKVAEKIVVTIKRGMSENEKNQEVDRSINTLMKVCGMKKFAIEV